MWIIDWIYDSLYWLGLLSKNAKILFLGLDNAGKSTLLLRLTEGKLGVLQPTARPNSREIMIGNTRCATFDLGGHRQARRLWKDYFPEVSGILFLVDAKDPERFEEAREELDALLAMEELAEVPFAVLGNKIDHPDAVSELEFRQQLGLSHPTNRPVEVFMCSIALKMGYAEALNWIVQQI